MIRAGWALVPHIKGNKSHDIVMNALTMLEHMDHRGACGCEQNTGDGAGILTGLPHEFLVKVAMRDAGIGLPEKGRYGGRESVFLPTDNEQRAACDKCFKIIAEQGQTFLGWRDVPVDNSSIGLSARRIEPVMKMLFIGAGPGTAAAADPDVLERQLYLIRKVRHVCLPRYGHDAGGIFLHLSAVHEGVDLQGTVDAGAGDGILPRRPVRSAVHFPSVLVHSRFSTNTFPSWIGLIRSASWRITAKSIRGGGT